MPELIFRKYMGSLRPETDEAMAYMNKLGSGQEVLVTIKDPRSRSSQQNRYWHKLLHLVWDNSERIQTACGDFDTFKGLVKIECGAVATIKKKNGDIVRIPQSVAFDKMEQADFNALVEKTLQVFATWGFDPDALRMEAE